MLGEGTDSNLLAIPHNEGSSKVLPEALVRDTDNSKKPGPVGEVGMAEVGGIAVCHVFHMAPDVDMGNA